MGGCASLETLPSNISGLSRLQYLFLDDCKSLRALPDLSGSLDGRELRITFLNCSELTEKQDVIGWVKKYLHAVLKNKRQGLPSPPNLRVLTSSAGGGIPGWFNYVEGGSLKVELPPYWFNNEFLGFSIFLGFHGGSAATNFYVTVKAWITTENPISVDLYDDGWFFTADTCCNSDVVSLHFFPRNKSKSADCWNSLSRLEVSTAEFGDWLPSLKPKYIGLRIVYEQDVEELSGWSGTSSSPPFHNVVSTTKNKRSHDDDGCSSDSQVESSIDSEGETRPPSSKRLKLEGDEL